MYRPFFYASAFLTLICAVAMIGCATATPTGATVSDDVERVAQVRRQLRAACGRLRMAAESSQSRATLLTQAADTTRLALHGWRGIRNDYLQSSPPAYAAHPQWDQSAAEIQRGIERMLTLAEQSKPSESIQACGQTCGLFVKLNAQAGIRRTSDTLFLFRKTAKPLAQAAQAGDHAALVAALPRLLELRQHALTEPVGGSVPEPVRRDALQAFSNAVDGFAAAVRNQRPGVGGEYTNMMRAMETAYDAYL